MGRVSNRDKARAKVLKAIEGHPGLTASELTLLGVGQQYHATIKDLETLGRIKWRVLNGKSGWFIATTNQGAK